MTTVELPDTYTPRPAVVTEPGVYDMPDATYHADPVPSGSLSSSGARRLLPPSCPAKFAYERVNGRPNRATFDLGHAAHLRVLGAGPKIVVIDAADWRTKAAKEQRDLAYAAGHVPLLTEQAEQVDAMADAIRSHELAGALFNPATGDAEQSAFWVDEATGVWCRARFDFLRDRAGRVLAVDYKTTDSADLEHIRRAVHRYGYHQQDAWYLDGITVLGLAEDPGFLFVFQEKTPPYLVTVVELDPAARDEGRAANRRAIEVYAECTRANRWPGYADDIAEITLPPWAIRTEEITR